MMEEAARQCSVTWERNEVTQHGQEKKRERKKKSSLSCITNT